MKHNHKLFLDIAELVSEESSAVRLKVGAVIAKDGSIIDFGYNGTPPGWDNSCEICDERGVLTTKPEVIHAEMNCILKCAKLGKSVAGATLYLTHNPCQECAKSIVASGISEVWYVHDYRCDRGVQILKSSGVRVFKYAVPAPTKNDYLVKPDFPAIDKFVESMNWSWGR